MQVIQDYLSQSSRRSADLRRPLVTLAYAQSLDGCLALQRGQETALSGREASVLTHTLRAAHQGILVGVGTVIADNPSLTVRLVAGKNPRPLVLDSALRIPPESALLRREHDRPWIVCGEAAANSKRAEELRQQGITLLPCVLNEQGQVDLRAGLEAAWKCGLETVMVEGGARVIGTVLKMRLFDQAVITISPVWLGGLAAVESVPGDGSARPGLDETVYETYGKDVVVWGKAAEMRF